MRTFVLPALLLVALPAIAAAPLTFEEVDTDGDGLISADEAANVEGLDFNAADGDNDGTLTVDEYEIAVESLSSPSDADASGQESTAPATSPDTANPSVPPRPSAGGGTTAPAPAMPPSLPAKPPATGASPTPGGAAPIPATPPASIKP